MKVLIAEDDLISHKVLKAILNKSGYEVISTYNGIEAWQALQGSDRPRLAILDWMMPQMDGIEIIQKIRCRNDPKYVYIILLTAKSLNEDLEFGLNAGADDYITKPYDNRELNARLSAACRIMSYQQTLEERIQDLNSSFGGRQNSG